MQLLMTWISLKRSRHLRKLSLMKCCKPIEERNMWESMRVTIMLKVCVKSWVHSTLNQLMFVLAYPLHKVTSHQTKSNHVKVLQKPSCCTGKIRLYWMKHLCLLIDTSLSIRKDNSRKFSSFCWHSACYKRSIWSALLTQCTRTNIWETPKSFFSGY